ncbi:MAG: hypothetical protein IPM91_12950 [Bacteroidetes bacterium]|nr:hypothetical protein [Bacteroidota bacterium]
MATDFDPGLGVHAVNALGNSDIYFSLDDSGNFRWVKTMGSNSGPKWKAFANRQYRKYFKCRNLQWRRLFDSTTNTILTLPHWELTLLQKLS